MRERQRRGMRKDDVTGDWVNGMGFWTEDSPWIAWTSDIDEYKKSLEELQAAYDENQQTLADIKKRVDWRRAGGRGRAEPDRHLMTKPSAWLRAPRSLLSTS